jgi:vacuolar-type H+-ATPase subunit H
LQKSSAQATTAIADAIEEQTPKVSEDQTSDVEEIKSLVEEAVKSAMESLEQRKPF